MITLEGITKKLGFNPLRHQYATGNHEDDNWENPFKNLTIEEIEFIHNAAINDPACWTSPRDDELIDVG